jgi:hypothetical protein
MPQSGKPGLRYLTRRSMTIADARSEPFAPSATVHRIAPFASLVRKSVELGGGQMEDVRRAGDVPSGCIGHCRSVRRDCGDRVRVPIASVGGIGGIGGVIGGQEWKEEKTATTFPGLTLDRWINMNTGTWQTSNMKAESSKHFAPPMTRDAYGPTVQILGHPFSLQRDV